MVKQIKANESISHIPLFLFGEMTKTNMQKNVEKFGVQGSIPKPFSFEEFDVFLKLASKPVIDDITLWDFDDENLPNFK